MIRYGLNLFYLAAIGLFSPWLLFAAIRKGKYREGFAQKFLGASPRLNKAEGGRFWIHAVSVGEVNLVVPILRGLTEHFPEAECVISSTSRTGYHLAKKLFPNHVVFYAPLDFTWSIRRAFRRILPDRLILVELELWPNLLWEAEKRGVPVFVMNGRLGEASFRNYRRAGFLMRRILRPLTQVFAQDEESGARFHALGVPAERLHVVGSLKYDGAETDRQNARTVEFRRIWGLTETETVFLAGSTQAPEESLALQTFQELRPTHPELRLILVPRHAERFEEVALLLTQSGESFRRRSQFSENPTENASRILLVDTVGELGAWWGVAEIGFVGGSLLNRRGGQNMIEPTALGVCTCFGPNTWNFRDIVRTMLFFHAAEVVHNVTDLTSFVERCLNDSAFRTQRSQNACRLVIRQQGALPKTMDLLKTILSSKENLS